MDDSVPYEGLGAIYQNAAIVLCDHSPGMSLLGYLSNRMLDVWASGAALICDTVKWLPAGTELRTARCTTVDDFRAAVDRFSSPDGQSAHYANAISAMVRDNHSFDARAAQFVSTLRALAK